MALYVYKKRKSKIVKAKTKKPFVAPVMLFTTGLVILAYIAYPYLNYYLAKTFNNDNVSKELLSPQNSFIAYAKTDENTSSNYDQNIAQSISDIDREIKNDNLSAVDLSGEQGKMYLTIEKINLKHVPITLNVSSSAESEYNPVLNQSIAHFKGTSLPGYPGKTFLYGHSSRSLVNTGRSFGTIFTDLDQMNLGDEFTVEYKDKIYKYSVFKVKVVNRDDFSILKGDSRKTITLMTCIPPGVGSQRLIVEAFEEDGE